jgi:hypothetical protein
MVLPSAVPSQLCEVGLSVIGVRSDKVKLLLYSSVQDCPLRWLCFVHCIG